MRALRRAPPAVMATLRFLLKRFVAQRLLGLAVVVTLAFTSACWSPGRSTPMPLARRSCPPRSAARASRSRTPGCSCSAVADLDWVAADAAITGAFGACPSTPWCRRAWARCGSAEPTARRCRSLFREGAPEHLEIEGEPPAPARSRCLRARRPPSTCEAGDSVALVGPQRRVARPAHLGHVRLPRSRRSVLVRRPQPVPRARLDRPAAGARRPRHVPRCRRHARPHDGVSRGTRSSPWTACRSSRPRACRRSSPRSRTRCRPSPACRRPAW